jgi:hypothetical protein
MIDAGRQAPPQVSFTVTLWFSAAILKREVLSSQEEQSLKSNGIENWEPLLLREQQARLPGPEIGIAQIFI